MHYDVNRGNVVARRDTRASRSVVVLPTSLAVHAPRPRGSVVTYVADGDDPRAERGGRHPTEIRSIFHGC